MPQWLCGCVERRIERHEIVAGATRIQLWFSRVMLEHKLACGHGPGRERRKKGVESVCVGHERADGVIPVLSMD